MTLELEIYVPTYYNDMNFSNYSNESYLSLPHELVLFMCVST